MPQFPLADNTPPFDRPDGPAYIHLHPPLEMTQHSAAPGGMPPNKTYPQCALLAVLILLASAGALFATACGSNRFGRDLAATLSQNPAAISFAAIAPWQWTSVEIYGPYTPADRLSPAAAHGSSARSRRILAHSDAHHLVVFIQNDAAVYHELLPRNIADFHFAAGLISLPRSAANFAVSRSTDAGGTARTTLFIMR